MNIIKRGVILLVFLLLFASFAQADEALTLNLTREQFGTGQALEGALSINLSSPLPKNAILTFVIDSVSHGNKTLNDLATGFQNVDELAQELQIDGNPVSTAELNFEQAGSLLNYAFDLSQEGTFTRSDIREILSFNMDVRGSTFRGGAPTSPSINIGNDEDLEWVYKGPRKPGVFLPVNDSYLGDRVISSQAILTADSDKIYCQNITLPPASKYKVKTLARFLNTEAKLNATISKEKPRDFLGLCREDAPCCTFPTKPTSMSEMSCDIDLDVNDEESYFVCVYADLPFEAPTPSDEDFISIAFKTGEARQGFSAGRKAGFDYFIWTEFEDFERRLTTTESLDVSESASEEIKKHAKAAGCTDACLLVPLNITSLSPGALTLSNLQLRVDTKAAGISIQSLTPITFRPESLHSNTTIIKLNLLDFTELLAPTVEGEGFTITAVLGGVSSEAIAFNVVPGPEANIRYNTLLFQPGEELIVRGEAEAVEDREIIGYSWDFGDGGTATGEEATHSYSEPGSYTVRLSVEDSEGIIGTAVVVVDVSMASLSEQITETEETFTALDARIQSNTDLADVLNTLGLVDVIEGARTNFTTLQADFEALGESTENTTEEAELIILEKLRAIRAILPKDVTAEGALNFDAKIERRADIPSTLPLPLEEFAEEKVLKAQADATLQGSARIVRISYLDGKEESFILVKKSISGLFGETYEILPSGVIRRSEITPIEEAVSNNILKFGQANIIYTVEGSTLADLTAATQIKTIVVPDDLSLYQIEEGEEGIGLALGECGNGDCEAGEDAKICPEDCKKKRPIALIIALIIVLIAGVVWIFVYKGPYSFHSFFGAKPTTAKKLFKTEKDYNAVKSYVMNSKQKGFNSQQVILALRKQKWTPEQIRGIMLETSAKKGMKASKRMKVRKSFSLFGIKIRK